MIRWEEQDAGEWRGSSGDLVLAMAGRAAGEYWLRWLEAAALRPDLARLAKKSRPRGAGAWRSGEAEPIASDKKTPPRCLTRRRFRQTASRQARRCFPVWGLLRSAGLLRS